MYQQESLANLSFVVLGVWLNGYGICICICSVLHTDSTIGISMVQAWDINGVGDRTNADLCIADFEIQGQI